MSYYQELPFDPVMAEDGKIYEEKPSSSGSPKKMVSNQPEHRCRHREKLLPAVQTKNTIEMLIKSGAIEGEIAEAWKQKLEDETL